MNRLLDWLDHRTGYRHLLNEALYENIPSGARFRYITGSMLVFAFVTQAITGIFLWMAYSPSSQTAYESVWWIQYQMTGGWLLRGIHHFMAQMMVVVMGLHLLQIVWDGAYRKPREINHWLGLILMQIVMGLGLTGYLLPWDQKGYWATNVATNLATLVPGVGKEIQQVAVGGSEYGHHTLTRFFALHAGLLPALMVIFLAMHIAAFRRQGITAHITPGRPDEKFWPKQVLFDAIGCAVLLAIVLLFTIHFDVAGLLSGKLPVAHRGAELGAPADPSEQYSAARPEWYFLFLFQLLKYFHGSSEVIGAIVIPGAAMGVLFLMPFIGRTRIGHAFNVLFIVGLLVGAVGLTGLALREDYFSILVEKSDDATRAKFVKEIDNSREFLKAKEQAEHDAHRTYELIYRRTTNDDGTVSEPLRIPRQGAVYLLRNDPHTQGPKLFGRHCASCHDHRPPAKSHEGANDHVTFANQAQSPLLDAQGKPKRDAEGKIEYDSSPNGAPNLYDFGSRAWIAGMLDPQRIDAVTYGEPDDDLKRSVTADYFGNTAHKGGRMSKWLKEHAGKWSDQQRNDIVNALSAQAKLRSQSDRDRKDAESIQRGVVLINKNCTSCHRLGEAGQLGLAPDLTGYGSYEWMMGFLSDPSHERFYRLENDRMPSFAQDLEHPQRHSVSIRELSLIVDWLRNDYFHLHEKHPVLPHDEETARRAVIAARTIKEPTSSVIGAVATPEKPSQRAERLFKQNCVACHSHGEGTSGIVARNPSAPNLQEFASRKWLAGLLDPERIDGDDYFGKTGHAQGDMANYVRDELKSLDAAKKKDLEALIAALSAEAKLPGQAAEDKKATDDKQIEAGKSAFAKSFGCADCHRWGDAEGNDQAPVLDGWGSAAWLERMIADPAHVDMYGDRNDRMPSFGVGGTGTKKSLLSKDDIQLLAKWLRGEKIEE